MLNCSQSIAVTAYIFYSKPFTDKFLNLQEKFNELTILLISYCVFMISDWLGEEEQTMIGFIIIGITSFNIFVNFSNMIYQIFR